MRQTPETSPYFNCWFNPKGEQATYQSFASLVCAARRVA
jgi:hypothetical protein